MITGVVEHCDDKGMEHWDEKAMEPCIKGFKEHTDDTCQGAL